jgi:hypothetical protein
VIPPCRRPRCRARGHLLDISGGIGSRRWDSLRRRAELARDRAICIYNQQTLSVPKPAAARPRPRTVAAASSLRGAERWTTNVSWPAPIDQRLSLLVDLAIDAGEPTSLTRAELLAAFVFDAPDDGAKLRAMLGRYRKAKAGEAAVGDASEASRVLVLTKRRPGRR